jgi:hypothetical protein
MAKIAALGRFLAHLGPVANRVAILIVASRVLAGCGMSGAGSAMPASTGDPILVHRSEEILG